jgi:hypothetical protein
MSAGGMTTSGRLINLVIPGGGLILIGSETTGVLIALLFTAAANFAIAAGLLFHDDVSPTWRGLGIGVAIGTYLGAQIRYAQTLRCQRARAAAQRRRAALYEVRCALLAGRLEDAWRAIRPLIGQAEVDLVVAYRLAQVLTARGNGAAALAAWRRVRRLDRHRIYRQEVTENERALAGHAGLGEGADPSAHFEA